MSEASPTTSSAVSTVASTVTATIVRISVVVRLSSIIVAIFSVAIRSSGRCTAITKARSTNTQHGQEYSSNDCYNKNNRNAPIFLLGSFAPDTRLFSKHQGSFAHDFGCMQELFHALLIV